MARENRRLAQHLDPGQRGQRRVLARRHDDLGDRRAQQVDRVRDERPAAEVGERLAAARARAEPPPGAAGQDYAERGPCP